MSSLTKNQSQKRYWNQAKWILLNEIDAWLGLHPLRNKNMQHNQGAILDVLLVPRLPVGQVLKTTNPILLPKKIYETGHIQLTVKLYQSKTHQSNYHLPLVQRRNLQKFTKSTETWTWNVRQIAREFLACRI